MHPPGPRSNSDFEQNYFFVAQGFAAQGFAAQGFFAVAFLPLAVLPFLTAHGFAAQGFFAHGFAAQGLAAQGFFWAAYPTAGITRNADVTTASIKRANRCFMKTSLLR